MFFVYLDIHFELSLFYQINFVCFFVIVINQLSSIVIAHLKTFKDMGGVFLKSWKFIKLPDEIYMFLLIYSLFSHQNAFIDWLTHDQKTTILINQTMILKYF